MAEPKPKAEDYEWGNILGEGAFGDVVKAVEKKTGKTFAIKKILKTHMSNSQQGTKTIMNERNVLGKCWHPNIVKLYSAFRDTEFFYYVLSYAENGEVLKWIRQNQGLHIEVVKFWSAEVICALEYLHKQGIIHRDLKPENLLVDSNWHILLTDFGTSKIVTPDEGTIPRKGSFVGTAEYMPPELVKDTESCFASDLWSLGCTIYQMLCSRPPFRAVTEYLTMKKVQEGVSAVVFPEPFPAQAKDLIEKLLQQNPSDRIGATNYDVLKKHPFFEGINWDQLHLQTPPPVCGPETKMIWQEDIIKEEQERLEKERLDLKEKWKPFLFPLEEILESGIVIKKRKMTKKKRFLILTNTPRIFYVDPRKMEFKGEIPWDYQHLKVTVKNDVVWTITIPKRVYDLEDVRKEAGRWKEAIEKCQKEHKEQK